LEKASLVGTNSVWGSVVSAKEIFSPERQQICKGREIFVHIYQLDCFVLAGVVYSVKDRSIHLGKTLELNINVVTIVMIVKKLVFIVLILV
jgi:hypothetical protein